MRKVRKENAQICDVKGTQPRLQFPDVCPFFNKQKQQRVLMDKKSS